MKKRRRGRYTKAFKADAVRLVLDEGISCAQVARDLGVNPNTLYDWVSKARSERFGSPSGHKIESMQEENRRLRRENRILKEEREILKKAAAFFAKESR